MKKTITKNLSKQIICIIIILMLCNFILPNYTYAEVETGEGGDLFVGLSGLFCIVPDTIMSFLQSMFVPLNDLKDEETGKFKIMYSPGIIFSGQVPALNINFINPNNNIRDVDIEAFIKKSNVNGVPKYIPTEEKDNINELLTNAQEKVNNNSQSGIMKNNTYKYSSNYGSVTYDLYYYVEDNKLYIESFGKYGHYGIEFGDYDHYQLFEETLTADALNSTLQSVISTWYKVFRRIALVGLLSVLVYIGIRMVLSSASSQNRAKYKSMFKDWLFALCLLFVLHYIMSITITIVNNISGIINASVIGESGEDVWMSNVRNKIEEGTKWGTVIPYLFIYCVLMVYTIIFTIQYVRRVIYIAFLTAIAPLITLTYPLDKIKDGKAQAFDMWIKDYVFFALLQIVHLLIYYVLVGNAINLNDEGYWLFSLVAIGFLTKAEKLMKKMFGFEKSSSMGALTAGATGALITNAINKLSSKAPKIGKGGNQGASQDGSNNIRTAKTAKDPLTALKQNQANKNRAAQKNGKTPGNSDLTSEKGEETLKRNIKGGAKSLLGKYGWSTAKGAAKGAAGILLGGTGALIGGAAGLAQGDLGAAATGLIAGGAAGKGIGEGAVNGIFNGVTGAKKSIENVTDVWNEGAKGKGYADTVKYKRTDDYKELSDKFKDDLTDDKLQKMIEAGITDKDAMDIILENEEDDIDKAIRYYAMANKCPESLYYGEPEKLEEFVNDIAKEVGLGSESSQEIINQMKKFRK